MPSLLRCKSVSIASAPTRTAASNAGTVFSGYEALYPRWAMVWGMRREVRSDGTSRGAYEAERCQVDALRWYWSAYDLVSLIVEGRKTLRVSVLLPS